MDEMTEYELRDIIRNTSFTDINSWEQCRLQLYIVSSMFSKNKLKPEDLMKFPWEHNNTTKADELPKTISDEDIARLKAKAKQRENNYKIQ